MAPNCNCPICAVAYDDELNLRVHLEVEHRKSELARFVVDRRDRPTKPPLKPTP